MEDLDDEPEDFSEEEEDEEVEEEEEGGSSSSDGGELNKKMPAGIRPLHHPATTGHRASGQ